MYKRYGATQLQDNAAILKEIYRLSFLCTPEGVIIQRWWKRPSVHLWEI